MPTVDLSSLPGSCHVYLGPLRATWDLSGLPWTPKVHLRALWVNILTLIAVPDPLKRRWSDKIPIVYRLVQGLPHYLAIEVAEKP